MSETTFEDVKTFILTKATAEELRVIVDYYKLRHKNIGVAIGLSFTPGEPVWFDAKTKGIIRGKFVRMKSKNAEVLSDTGVRWTVGPQLLRKG
jgi:hypothetical protein